MAFGKAHFQPSREGVELRETTAAARQATQESRVTAARLAPVPPIVEPEPLTSTNKIRQNAGSVRSNYRRAVEADLPNRDMVSTAVDTQSPSTSGSSAMLHSQLSSTTDADAMSVSQIATTREADATLRTKPSSGSLNATHRAPLYPVGDFRNSSLPDINQMKTEIMCIYLHQQQLKKMWSNGGQGEGVLLKRSRNEYHCCPPDLQLHRGGIYDAVKGLSVRVGAIASRSWHHY